MDAVKTIWILKADGKEYNRWFVIYELAVTQIDEIENFEGTGSPVRSKSQKKRKTLYIQNSKTNDMCLKDGNFSWLLWCTKILVTNDTMILSSGEWEKIETSF